EPRRLGDLPPRAPPARRHRRRRHGGPGHARLRRGPGGPRKALQQVRLHDLGGVRHRAAHLGPDPRRRAAGHGIHAPVTSMNTTTRVRAWLILHRLPIGAFLVALVVYGAVAADRLRRRSSDPHFSVQADAWLHGRLDIPEWPAGADDPAKIDEVRLDDGRIVRGRKMTTRQTFRIAGEGEIPASRVQATLRTLSY